MSSMKEKNRKVTLSKKKYVKHGEKVSDEVSNE